MENHNFGPVVIRDTDHRLYRHPDVGSAAAEATCLAKNNPGYRFAVYVPILYKGGGGATTAEISEFIAPIIREVTGNAL